MKALLVDGSIDSDELSENIYTILNDCYKSFKSSFFEENEIISCKLFSILNGEKDHIAPACNIASSIEETMCFLHSIGVEGKSVRNGSLSFVHIKIFITLLFYIYQELESYHKFILKDKGFASLDYYNGDFHQSNDRNRGNKNRWIQLIKTYVNFFKHPKLIIHLHHPKIYIQHRTGKNIEMDFISNEQLITIFDRSVSNEILEQFLNEKEAALVFDDITLLVSGIAKIATDLIDFSLNDENVKNIILNNLSCKLD